MRVLITLTLSVCFCTSCYAITFDIFTVDIRLQWGGPLLYGTTTMYSEKRKLQKNSIYTCWSTIRFSICFILIRRTYKRTDILYNIYSKYLFIQNVVWCYLFQATKYPRSMVQVSTSCRHFFPPVAPNLSNCTILVCVRTGHAGGGLLLVYFSTTP